MGMIFFAMIAGRLPYYGDPAALDASFARKGRPAIDPIWHEGFMEVRTCFMSYRIVNIFLFLCFYDLFALRQSIADEAVMVIHFLFIFFVLR